MDLIYTVYIEKKLKKRHKSFMAFLSLKSLSEDVIQGSGKFHEAAGKGVHEI